MARASHGGFAKRQRELARQEKRNLKQARRQEARERQAPESAGGADEDPDLAGIHLGPQPAAWTDEEPAEEPPPDGRTTDDPPRKT